jgi:NitT/TauT family transport system permease protein
MTDATVDLPQAAKRAGSPARRLFQSFVPVLLIAGFFVAWEVIQRATHYPPDFIAPLPSAILVYTVQKFPMLMSNLLVTLMEAGIGFVLGNLLAIGLAIVSVFNKDVERAIMPFALAVRSIPIIAITPVLVFLLGMGLSSKIAVAVIVSFFPTLVNMIVGLKTVDRRLLELLYVLNANKWQTLVRVRLPSSMPSFFAALKIAVPSSFLGAAVAEWINASAGIGYLIIISTYQFNTVMLYSTMLISTLVSALAYFAVVWLEGILVPWQKHMMADLQN